MKFLALKGTRQTRDRGLPAEAFAEFLGWENVRWHPAELVVYECDGYTIEKHPPLLVVFPRSTEDVVKIVRTAYRLGLKLLPRGAGTGLAGGATPSHGEVIVSLTRMNRIHKIDLANRWAVVEPGVLNTQLARALEGTGFHFAPDPSSQTASTLGGNAATNAGGPHTLKYGVTVNHVVGLEAVVDDGQVLQLGPVRAPGELDLMGLLVGSEGTLGIITKLWLRLTPNPRSFRTFRAIFDAPEPASEAISEIIAAGIIPAALELMDRGILDAVEEAFHFGFPPDAGAVVVIELDGFEAALAREAETIFAICRKWGAREILEAQSQSERQQLWKCRKLAVAAVGRLSPSYCIQDGVVPRTRLPAIIREVQQIGSKYGLRIVNVAHAGDGNIHPIFLFDERNCEQVQRVLAAGREILERCLALGGSITAEHGVGLEKLPLMELQFAPNDLEAMRRVRMAFDSHGSFAPGKVLPARS
ncbi:MAG: FAD-linked oxidase C-terminal domain-containing protein [Thermoguttaceae bacterium]|nr:FAD-linked oxidase C-terminal domain-containing protein [Thermoguttaceae bacterium]